jgi:hypothetical protein
MINTTIMHLIYSYRSINIRAVGRTESPPVSGMKRESSFRLQASRYSVGKHEGQSAGDRGQYHKKGEFEVEVQFLSKLYIQTMVKFCLNYY